MDNDDVLVGRLLSRREMLVLLGGAGLALVVGCSDDDSPDATPTNAATSGATQAPTAGSTATAGASGTTTVPACVVVPELTEGPFFLDGMLERQDITSDPGTGAVSEGAPLALTVMAQSFWVGVAGIGVAVPAIYLMAHFGTEIGAKVLLPWWLMTSAISVTMVMALLSGLLALRSLRMIEPVTLLR